MTCAPHILFSATRWTWDVYSARRVFFHPLFGGGERRLCRQGEGVFTLLSHPPSPFRLLFPILRFPILQTIYFEVFFTVKVIFHVVKNRFNHHGSTPQEFDLKFFPVLKLWIRKIQNYDRNRLKLA